VKVNKAILVEVFMFIILSNITLVKHTEVIWSDLPAFLAALPMELAEKGFQNQDADGGSAGASSKTTAVHCRAQFCER